MSRRVDVEIIHEAVALIRKHKGNDAVLREQLHIIDMAADRLWRRDE